MHRFRIPDKELIQLYLKCSLILGLIFVLFYGGANWINGSRSDHLHLYLHWELSLPFVPEMIFVYLSLQLLFLAPVFHCNSEQIRRLAKQMAVSIIIASLIFIIVPTVSGYDRSVEAQRLSRIFSALHALDKPYNLFPSLHVTLGVLAYRAVTHSLNGGIKTCYAVWLLSMIVSVLLVHQHHIADIAGGLLLALVCLRIFHNNSNLQSV